MNIHEYQARDLFSRYGLPLLPSKIATTPTEARKIAQELGSTAVVKAQVLVGGRGKAGGIKLAPSPDEAEAAAAKILGMEIKGEKVRRVLVATAADIASELYLGAVVDRNRKKVVMMASSEGGIDIEELAQSRPEKIIKVEIHPFLGLQDHQARWLGFAIGLDGELCREFTKIAQGLYRALVDWDASLAEINPLAITRDRKLVVVDAKIVLDDNAAFRHPEYESLRDLEAENPYEREARLASLNFVKLEGTVGCVVNGAGLAMASMDLVKDSGGAPANFLDMGGGARSDQVAAALRIIISDPSVKAVMFNIFGGITRCDEVARGIVEAMKTLPREVPLVVRLVGTNEEIAREILAKAKMMAANSMKEAAELAVKAS